MDRPCGEPGFARVVTPSVYVRARWLASRLLGRGGPTTLSPSDLTGAAIQRLEESGTRVVCDRDGPPRGRIFALLALAMRSVVVERGRRRAVRVRLEADRARARGSPAWRGDQDDHAQCAALLARLRAISPRRADAFELRAVHGLTVAEAAECLSVCERTIESDYRGARAWLQGELIRRGMGPATTG